MARRRTRKQRALELLRTLRNGPAFSSAWGILRDREFDLEAAKEDYRLWAHSWIIPVLLELVPELKGRTRDDVDEMYYIQDTRQFVGNCPMWWGPDGAGYVTRLDEAGRYTYDQAIRQNRARETDVPWKCSEIDALARLTVDYQHMRSRVARLTEIAAELATEPDPMCRCGWGDREHLKEECTP